MHYASVENISKSFGARELFDSISFHIEEGDKIALIARNGSGKSTLLNILSGRDTPDSGTVWVHKDVQVIMLPQESSYDPGLSVWENLLSLDHPVIRAVKAYESASLVSDSAPVSGSPDALDEMDRLDAWGFESQVRQVLGRLSLHHPEVPMRQLSGGQRKRVALAQALLEAQLHGVRTLLLLDEPTNHLDVDMIEWLQEYLSTSRSTLLLVTHDRYFLDNVCNEIIELDAHSAYVYRGDYDYFLNAKAARIDAEAATGAKNKNLFRKELEWMRKQPKARTTKSRAREDNYYALEEKVKQRVENTELTLQGKMTRLGGKVMEMKKVYKSFGSLPILRGFDYTFKKGERIGIVGKNGVGKSTFIRLLMGLDTADSGKINPGDTVVFGHFSQEGLEWTEDLRVIEYVKSMAEFFPLADGSKISAAQFLQLFAFPPEQQYTFLSKLSGGEKKRLQLLTILFRNPNFLVLDEPTNDLDLQTLRILEDFLVDFAGCLLIVSHDRYFMDRVVDHLFVFEGEGRVRDFPGNYSQYRSSAPVPTPVAAPPPPSAPAPFSARAAKLSYKERQEFEQLGADVAALDSEKRALETSMSTGNLPYDELQRASARMLEVLALLEVKEMRWLELSERA